MKYIKTYESIKNFKVGDYVFITKLSKHFPEYKKLFKISKNPGFDSWLLHSIPDDNFSGSWTSDRMRKATKKEIADYMLKINREKYNV